jgi:hypothetical protein
MSDSGAIQLRPLHVQLRPSTAGRPQRRNDDDLLTSTRIFGSSYVAFVLAQNIEPCDVRKSLEANDVSSSSSLRTRAVPDVISRTLAPAKRGIGTYHVEVRNIALLHRTYLYNTDEFQPAPDSEGGIVAQEADLSSVSLFSSSAPFVSLYHL